ncbi:hypothetical protein IQ268_04550 [Oculatella sp. LEGE 06141]|uniref:hypothetical protein n=1 Tax=Oculatella sp. LEGE 06141 TaxID=1828648 RepID=UPI00187E6078|nr:hypothetical protein [Oculatella sp. LEGE 06141]MBE9177852.1 hypothetical protein [Oculatella sp. LEGE 06141]
MPKPGVGKWRELTQKVCYFYRQPRLHLSAFTNNLPLIPKRYSIIFSNRMNDYAVVRLRPHFMLIGARGDRHSILSCNAG